MPKYFSLAPRRCIASWLPLLGALAGAACGSTDGRALLLPAAGSGGQVSSAGSAGVGVGGASGTGGSGGVEPGDAGAPPDASIAERSCVVGSLAAYCAANLDCPATYADARTALQTASVGGQPRLILQQACVAPDGAPRIQVSGDYFALSLSYIFDPATGQLVSVYIYDDLGGCPYPGERIDNESFGSIHGFYGEELPGCRFEYGNSVPPAACRLPADWYSLDAGALRPALVDAGADAGSLDDGGPYECILAP